METEFRTKDGRFKKGIHTWLGKKFSIEHRLKISNAHKGKKLSEEQKNKLRLSNAGIKNKGKSYEDIYGIVKAKQLKEKLRLSHIGQKGFFKGKKRPEISNENHYCWKGGITPVNEKIRKSLEYRIWRTAVFERDDYTCIWCGLKSGNGKAVTLHADHIKPFADYPELRFAIDNGRTLCVECHKKTCTWGRPIKIKTV